MPFPESKRIIYEKNPLDRVIFQLRFPTILKIEESIPVLFQDSIKNEYPEFLIKDELTMPVPFLGKKEESGDEIKNISPSHIKNYEFSTEDKIWKINLTRTFLALTCTNYTRRSDFNNRLKLPLKLLLDIYKPSYFSRIGLRYIDIIIRSSLRLSKVPWNKLLKPYILGFLGSDIVNKKIKSFQNQCEILLNDRRSIARIVTSLVESEKNDELCLMIDTDFYNSHKIEASETKVMKKLDYFQVRGSRLIQWIITPKLHKAMKPVRI